MRVAVNVSARQVVHLVVGDQVAHATAAAGTAASDLLLEITERVLLAADDDVLAELRAVTAAGCGLAISDFGTSYSSLTYLTRFPVTTLKIDRTFVGASGSAEDTVVVAAVIGLAKSLELTAVAEGVEPIPCGSPRSRRVPPRAGLPPRPPDDVRRALGLLRAQA